MTQASPNLRHELDAAFARLRELADARTKLTSTAEPIEQLRADATARREALLESEEIDVTQLVQTQAIIEQVAPLKHGKLREKIAALETDLASQATTTWRAALSRRDELRASRYDTFRNAIAGFWRDGLKARVFVGDPGNPFTPRHALLLFEMSDASRDLVSIGLALNAANPQALNLQRRIEALLLTVPKILALND